MSLKNFKISSFCRSSKIHSYSRSLHFSDQCPNISSIMKLSRFRLKVHCCRGLELSLD